MSSQPPRPRNVHELAKLLIGHYGEQAFAHAMHQALKARRRGDRRTMESWRWVAGAVREILRSEPEEGGGEPSS